MANTFLVSLLIFTQYFGQNKIQYKDFDFEILSTEHFDIHFYPGGEDIAAFAEEVLEDGYAMLSEDLAMEIGFRIPVILYLSPNDFSQTNVTLGLIEEGVGGFTEILKNRMVIPFSGDYEEFRHVLVHELAHVFQFVIFFPSRLEAIFSGDIFYSIPDWVFEGHCEFVAMGWDIDTDIFIRDLIINNNLVPIYALENYGGRIIYKEGQAFFRYIAEKYGRKKTGEFLHLLKAKKNLETTFITLFGVTPEEFNKRWNRYYQLQYWPKIGLQDNFEKFARVVVDHKKTNSIYNVSTAVSPNGDKIAFISDQTGTAEILIVSSIDGRLLKKLVKSEYSSGYEGLHLFEGGLSWSSDGDYITFAAKSKGEDVLYVMNANNGKVYKRFKFNLDGIYSPRFSPAGNEIIFWGLKDSYSDIYACNIESGIIDKITDDIYTDKYPDVSSDGSVVFVSDRPDSNEDYYYGGYAVFLYKNGNIARLTKRTSYVASPFFDTENNVFFVADYDSAYNLYFYSLAEAKIAKKTEIFSSIYHPSISRDDKKIVFSYYNDYGYDVCVVKDPLSKMIDADLTDQEEMTSENAYAVEEVDKDRIKKYKPKFSVDYFVASAAYYSSLGFSGVGMIALSDVLGNHHIQFASNFYGSFTDSDIFINYFYLKKRIDYGLSLFQYLNYFSDFRDLIIWRYLGLGGVVQYPLDRFLRVEFGIYAFKVYETRWFDFFPDYYSTLAQKRNFNLFYPELALVYDNVQWGPISPHSGRRVRVGGYATLLSNYEVRTGVLDYRRYFGLSPRSSFAARLILVGSFGRDPDHWSIGGPNSLRGFDYYAFTGTKVGCLNLELRFPFIDRLKIAFPIPMEFRNIRGVLFADFGGVYTDSFKVYETEGRFHLKDLKMGVGAGLRFNFLYIIFRLDFARATNLREWVDENGERSKWKFYLTLSPDW